MIPLLNRDVPVVIGIKGRRTKEVKKRTGLRRLEVHKKEGGPHVHMRGTRESIQQATAMIEDVIQGKLNVIGDVTSTMRIAA